MLQVNQIIKALTDTSARTTKEQILLLYKNNNLFMYILKFIYNPYIKTGLAEKKMLKMPIQTYNVSTNFKNIYEAIEYLNINNTGRDEDVKILLNFIANESEELHDLYIKIFCKSLKIGITNKTLVKLFGDDFVPQFPIMKGFNYFNYKDKVKGQFFIITNKLDGNRIILIKDIIDSKPKITVYSSSGKEITDLNDIKKEAEHLPVGAYDGELKAINNEGLDREELFRKTQKILRTKGIKIGLCFHVFDTISIDDFQRGYSPISCIQRKLYLQKLLNALNSDVIKEVPMLFVGDNISVIDDYFNNAIECGEEGIMINIAEAPYEGKRSYQIFKMKAEHTIDLKIIGFERGKTGHKFANTLGSFIVDYKGFKVGVGIMPEMVRQDMWKSKTHYLNQIVEIKYTEETQDENGNLSLRFPRFNRMRPDKKQPSYE